MQLTGFLNDSTPLIYASGLYTLHYKRYRAVAHSGADAAYRSYFIRFTDMHFSVIVLANLADISLFSLSFKVADLFLKDN